MFRVPIVGVAAGPLLKLNSSVRQCNQQDADALITISSVFCTANESLRLARRSISLRDPKPCLVRDAASSLAAKDELIGCRMDSTRWGLSGVAAEQRVFSVSY